MNTKTNAKANANANAKGNASASVPMPSEPRLLRALRQQAERRGHTQIELAQHLGVTSGYLIMLRSGARDVSHISLDFARACAAYLETSTLNVLLLAGSLDVSDFSEPGTPEKRRLRQGLQALREDPLYGAYVDAPVLESLPRQVQQLLVSVYEEACQRDFGDRETLPPVLWSSLRLAMRLAAQEVQESAHAQAQ